MYRLDREICSRQDCTSGNGTKPRTLFLSTRTYQGQIRKGNNYLYPFLGYSKNDVNVEIWGYLYGCYAASDGRDTDGVS